MKVHHQTTKKAKTHGITLTIEDGEIVASKGDIRLASGLSGTVVLDKAIWAASTKQTDPSVAEKPAKAPKTLKAKKAPKSSGPHEDAARLEGWKPVKAGGFKQDGVDGEDGGESDAASWRDLCEEQDIEVESEGNSIVKPKYRALYRPNKNSNGDDLSRQLREYLECEGENGETGIDAAKLRRFAIANECWVESYASLRTASGSVNVGQQRMNIGNRLRAKTRKDPEYAIKWPK